jgi:citrate synthase
VSTWPYRCCNDTALCAACVILTATLIAHILGTCMSARRRCHCKNAVIACREDPLLEVAVELEKIATQDEYFVKRGLYPNVGCRCSALTSENAALLPVMHACTSLSAQLQPSMRHVSCSSERCSSCTLQVDFFSGIVLRALGIPVSMFTVLFAVARAVGWSCHWREMVCCSVKTGPVHHQV